MAGFGPGPIGVDAAFEQSFGNQVSNEQMYSNPWAKKDMRPEMYKTRMPAIHKALTSTSGGAGTAGNALIPVFVDPEIVDLTRKQTPIVELIPRRAIRGKTIDFNQITAITAAQWLNEDAALSEQTDTYTRQTVAIKYLYSVGRITGPAQSAMRGYLDGLNFELRNKTLAMRYLEEETILRGNTSGSSAFANTRSFVGFENAITTNSAAQSDFATISAIRTRVDNAFNTSGIVQWAVTDPFTHTYLKGLLMDFQRFVGEQENLPFGIRGSYNIDGVDFIKSRFMNTTSTSRNIFFIDPTAVEMGVLQDMTFQELAKTNDSDKFMLKMYEALAMKAQQFCASLTSIS
ncbi:hypothetical protein LCGC14_1400530 [marine sediment metagenome]|uniref:Bacteriophage Mu GpT domain-containing protein n=1 Tax=marine sediment metagenome TaxID=412755 RepID=A0A0F9MYU0_9ZZZZ